MADEDLFSDDGFDDIPVNTLDALEQRALASTQRRTPAPLRAPQQVAKPVASHAAPLRPAPQPQHQSQWQRVASRPQTVIQAELQHAPSSDYGTQDEDVIDLDEPSMVIQPASGPQQARPAHARSAPRAVVDYSDTQAAYAAADAESGSNDGAAWSHASHLQHAAAGNMNVSALQARIAELEAYQARLQQSEQEARQAALAKQGEISIVRANHEKAAKEYERRIAVMQKLHTDESTKQKAELDAGRKEREKMATDNKFLQHEVAQEAERARALSGPAKARLVPNGTSTPRKVKKMRMGDGFDDDEVLVLSPSKSKDKGKDQTPKSGPKRKRSAHDSPVAPLSFGGASLHGTDLNGADHPPPARPADTALQGRRAKSQRNIMALLMSHRSHDGHRRSIEVLAGMALPSNKDKSISSLITDSILLSSSIPSHQDELNIVLCALLKTWTRCVEEQYPDPVRTLVNLVHFLLRMERPSRNWPFVVDALPICLRTADLIVFPTIQAAVKPKTAIKNTNENSSGFAELLDIDDIVELLHYFCGIASLSAEWKEHFWRAMPFEFALLMLNKALSVAQVTLMLQMLVHAALPASFGPISADAEKQIKQQKDVVERMTNLLFETPSTPKDEDPYGDDEIAEFRLEIIKVFRAMCLTEHGGLLLAQHRSAIGRFIRFIDRQINRLYALPHRSVAHGHTVKAINWTMRLIHHLLSTYDGTINISDKLNVIHGGYHIFLISMTRIAFSEQLVYEHGIEDEVAEAAHTILDNILSPEEGANVREAVETPRSTRSGGPEKMFDETADSNDVSRNASVE